MSKVLAEELQAVYRELSSERSKVSELSEFKKLFEECQMARDEVGFIGSVPDCIKSLDAELSSLRVSLGI